MLLFLALMQTGCITHQEANGSAKDAERTAIAFLTKEVPAWSKENGCFSCHNNGDAARALYLASQKGYEIPAIGLADTTLWVTHPSGWDKNKGDPGFSDKRLADVQFAASLLAAIESGRAKGSESLNEAASRLIRSQAKDGSWPIGARDTLGSPATLGTPLATYMAVRILKRIEPKDSSEATRRAGEWLRKVPVDTVLNAATLLCFANDDPSGLSAAKKQECLAFIRRAQTGDGGWGPYADAPPEVFDTAIVLIALASLRQQEGMGEVINRGRKYLLSVQYDDGSWPETTRPSGGESYAQRLSTTGWAVQALLLTRGE